MKSAFALIMGLAVLVLGASLRADEEKVALKDVPKAVLDAVKAKFPHAQLKGAVKEKEDDEMIYEISIVDQGKKIDVSVDDEGEIEKTETEIAVSELPKAVTDAIKAKYPKATIQSAEVVVEFEDGKAEDEKDYAAVIVTADKKTIEVVLSSEGKIIEEEK